MVAWRIGPLVLLSLVVCGPSDPGGTQGASTLMESATEPATETATTATTETETETETGEPEEDWSVEYGPCTDGACEAGQVCAHGEGFSICGPSCYELGPGANRCPHSPIQAQSFCPFNYIDGLLAPAPCLITCDVAADCPLEGMICVDCPETYYGCDGFFNLDPRMCAWPTP